MSVCKCKAQKGRTQDFARIQKSSFGRRDADLDFSSAPPRVRPGALGFSPQVVIGQRGSVCSFFLGFVESSATNV